MTEIMTSTPGVPAWTIADRLRKAREVSGLGQARLALVTGISRQTISNYERGATSPSKGNVKLIGLATGVDRYWLWDGTQVDPTTPSDQAKPSTIWFVPAVDAA